MFFHIKEEVPNKEVHTAKITILSDSKISQYKILSIHVEIDSNFIKTLQKYQKSLFLLMIFDKIGTTSSLGAISLFEGTMGKLEKNIKVKHFLDRIILKFYNSIPDQSFIILQRQYVQSYWE